MNKAIRTLGISILALTIGVGSAACSAPTTPQLAAESTSATHKPLVPSTPLAAPKDADGLSQRNATGVASDLNVFFASVKSETVEGLADIKKDNTGNELSEEELNAALQDNYQESLKYVDAKKLGLEKGRQLLGTLSILGIMSADITAVPEGITVSGDIATVPHSSMKVRVGEEDQQAKSGSITMNYSSGRWVITDYVASKK